MTVHVAWESGGVRAEICDHEGTTEVRDGVTWCRECGCCWRDPLVWVSPFSRLVSVEPQVESSSTRNVMRKR